MEKWMRKLFTVIQWTGTGLLSAYIVIACWSYSIAVMPFVMDGMPMPTMLTSGLMYGAMGGFLVGLGMAGFVEMVDYWKSR